MAFITLPFPTFTVDTIIDQSQMNANNAAILAEVNGGLDNTNFSSSAGISLSKLGLAPGSAAFNKTTASGQTWASGLTTDTQPRIAMTADLGLQFGPGVAAVTDVALIRSAATTLKLQAVGGGAASFDMNSGAILKLASVALFNGFAATITPAAIGAARAISFKDPGGTANLYCDGTGLTTDGVGYFDGSVWQTTAAGTAGNYLVSGGAGVAPSYKAPFTSADQTITAAGPLVLAHGLGYIPKNVWFALVNVTNEAGYTTGQVVLQGGVTTSSANQGYSAIVDGTNLTIRFGSGATTFSLPHATTGAATALTNANWTIRFFAQ